MRYNAKTGKVKLEENEIRIGNFFVKKESQHIKLQDLNGVFSFRAHRRMAVGIWLENMWDRAKGGDESGLNTLKTFIATMWSVYSVVPDDEYVKDALDMAHAAFDRHPEWYGMKKDATDAEHDAAAAEVREVAEFEGDVRKMDEKPVDDGEEV